MDNTCVFNSLVQPFDSYPAGKEAAQNMKVRLCGQNDCGVKFSPSLSKNWKTGFTSLRKNATACR